MSVRMELLTNNASSPDPLHQEVVHKRPLSYSKMENLIKEMQDPEHGVPVRSQKVFLSSIPAAFAGYDIIEWLMERLSIEDSVEAIHLANLLCQHGYFFPVGDNRNFSVKDDSSLYRFQSPYYWPSQVPTTDNVDYAIYLAKRSLRNKQKHALDDYEMEAFSELRKNLSQKWEFITMQADEQVRISKDRKKADKLVIDSQEKAFWRVLRPPPGFSCCVETPPMYKADFHAHEGVKQIRRTNILEDLRAEVDLLRTSCIRTRIKVSQALESLAAHCDSYNEHDPFLVPRQPSNPWISDDLCYWIINAPLVEVPTERRVKKWGISTEDLVFDATGIREFTAYLKKEYCHENIRFWLAVRDMKFGPMCQLRSKAQQIYNEFLSPGAPCEINIDMRTMEAVQKELNYLTPSRFTFDPAGDHVYAMLLKKDCYPRFIRSEHFKSLVVNALQPNQKKRLDKFFSFVAPGKKKSSTTTPPIFPMGTGLSYQSGGGFGGNLKGDDDFLYISAGNKCDLMSASSQDTDKLSVLADCPYRGDLIPDGRRDNESGHNTLSQASIDDVCPWESMEKLPSVSEKSASTSAPISMPHAKPSTSAAAAAAFSQSSPKTIVSKKSDENKPQRSGPPSKQSSILSKQDSVSSTKEELIRRDSHHSINLSQQDSLSNKLKDNNQQQFHQPFESAIAALVSVASSQATVSATQPAYVVLEEKPASAKAATTIASSTTITTTTTTADSSNVVTPTLSLSSTTLSSATLVPSIQSDETVKENEAVVEESKKQRKPSVSLSRTASKDTEEETGGSLSRGSSRGKENKDLASRKGSVVVTVLLPPIAVPSLPFQQLSTSPPLSAPPVEIIPKRKASREEDVCPWDHENGTRPETETFKKTYSTLGYL